MKVVGVYLAAGNSRRMGTKKLMLDLHGIPLGSWALQAALDSSVHHVLVITKRADRLSWLAPELFKTKYRKKWTVIQLKESHKGQAYSIKTGISEAITQQADAVLLQLADQPFVTSQIIDALIKACRKDPSSLFFASQYQGILGPPVLFTKRFFPKLMNLQGDKGARYLLNWEFKEKGKGITFEHEDHFIDVDTMADYAACRMKRDKRE